MTLAQTPDVRPLRFDNVILVPAQTCDRRESYYTRRDLKEQEDLRERSFEQSKAISFGRRYELEAIATSQPELEC